MQVWAVGTDEWERFEAVTVVSQPGTGLLSNAEHWQRLKTRTPPWGQYMYSCVSVNSSAARKQAGKVAGSISPSSGTAL